MGIKPSVIARRHTEMGRIRLGHKGERGNPIKLATFRFTSVDEQYIRDLAALYGGTPQPWRNGSIDEWEVFTEAKSIPVNVLKGGVSQWLETWSGGGCVHRCDGEVMQLPLANRPCAEDDTTIVIKERGKPDRRERAHDVARPTTRVSMMLTELESLGAWRLESHGWNAAAEIPAIAELASFVGDLVPATLNLVQRRSVSNGQTKQYVVPVLDLRIGRAKLAELVSTMAGVPELEAGTDQGRRALPSPMTGGSGEAASSDSTPGDVADNMPDDMVDAYADAFGEVAACQDRDALTALWASFVAQHLVGTHSTESPRRAELIAAWQARAREVPEHAADAPPPVVPDEDGIVDADIVEDGDADAVWRDVVMPLGGTLGMTLGDLEDGFAAWPPSGGKIATDATAAELTAYAEFLRESTR